MNILPARPSCPECSALLPDVVSFGGSSNATEARKKISYCCSSCGHTWAVVTVHPARKPY